MSCKFISVHLGRGQKQGAVQMLSVRPCKDSITYVRILLICYRALLENTLVFFILSTKNETEEIKCLFLFLTRLITITGAPDEKPQCVRNPFLSMCMCLEKFSFSSSLVICVRQIRKKRKENTRHSSFSCPREMIG